MFWGISTGILYVKEGRPMAAVPAENFTAAQQEYSMPVRRDI
jgi:hypothetical protein